MKTAVDKRILAARLSLSVSHPYFSSGLWMMRFYETKLISRMGITKSMAVAYNSDFLDSLRQDQIMGVLVHELMHILRIHSDRKFSREHKKFNYAADLEINDQLLEDGFKLTEDALLADFYGFEKFLTAEEYYDLLPEDLESGSVCSGNCGSGAGGDGDNEWEAEVAEEEEGLGSNKVTSSDIESIRNEIAKAVQYHQKTTGNVPGGILRWAEDKLGPPQIDWSRKLAFSMRKAIASLKYGTSDYSYSRPSRRASVYPDIIMPSMVAQKPPSVASIIDTSGSIEGDELTSFLSEQQGILLFLGLSFVRVLTCDAAVHSDIKVRKMSDLKDKILGCGGTDLRAGFDVLEGRDKPDIVIVFTDGYTPWPETNPVKKTIVVVSKNGTTDGVPSWAETIQLN